MKTSMTQHIIDSLPVMIAYVDNQENYQFVNNEYKNWLGIQEEQIILQKDYHPAWCREILEPDTRCLRYQKKK